MNLSPLPIQKFFDNNGNPLVNGRLFTYIAGTATKIATYKDQSGGPTNTNPIVLDFRGEASVWLDQTLTYKFVLAPPGVDDPPTSTIWTVDNISAAVTYASLTAMILGQILWPINAAEIAAGVTPTNYGYQWYIRGRYANFADWRLACDQAGAEGQLEADYAIIASTPLPNKCDFKGFKITGAFNTSHDVRHAGYVKNWRAKQVVISGSVFCRYTGIDTEFNFPPEDTGSVFIDGGVSLGGAGAEECDIEIVYTRTCTVTNDNGYVNFNILHGGGKCLYMHFTGTHATNELHANLVQGLNVFQNGAGTTWGLINDCVVQQLNFAQDIYYEGGANIVGPWHLIEYQGDGNGLPALTRDSYMMHGAGINSRLSRDFLPLSIRNLAQGGEWDMLDSAGKPICLTQSLGAAVAVVADTTEPSGCGQRYKADFSAAFTNFQITLQPSGSDRFGIVIYYQSTAAFTSITSNDGSGAINHTVVPVVVDAANNWKMLRVAGPASKTATSSVTLFAYDGVGGAAKTMSIGGVYAGSEKAMRLPQGNREIVSGTFTATATGFTTSVTGTAYYERHGNRITVFWPSLTGTSNANTCTVTGLPSFLIPARAQGIMPTIITDNGTTVLGRCEIDSTGVFTFFPSLTAAAAAWTAAGTKTLTRNNMTFLAS